MLNEFERELVFEMMQECHTIRIQQQELLNSMDCNEKESAQTADRAWERFNYLVRRLIEGEPAPVDPKISGQFFIA